MVYGGVLHRVKQLEKRAKKVISFSENIVLIIDDIPKNEFDSPIQFNDYVEGESITGYMQYLDRLGIEYIVVNSR